VWRNSTTGFFYGCLSGFGMYTPVYMDLCVSE